MNSFELTLSITTLAAAISQNLTPTEIAMIAGRNLENLLKGAEL